MHFDKLAHNTWQLFGGDFASVVIVVVYVAVVVYVVVVL